MENPKEELRQYLNKLIHRLLYVKGLDNQLKLLKEWETPRRIEAIEIGSYFFRLVGFSFYRTILIELCLLLDSREDKSIIDWLEKAKEHAKAIEPTIYNTDNERREIIDPEAYQKIITEHQNLIEEKKDIIKNIKSRRDTSLVHSDARYFNNPDDIYVNFPLSTDELQSVIETARHILRMQHVYLFESDLDIQVLATSNIDTILWHSRAFKRVWFDKRATSLYPYLYKLDDYEEKLKEHLTNKNANA